jgi:ribosomal protein S18 acetylase RimI-like enzyme
MHVEKLTQINNEELNELQPPDWNNIVPQVSYYISSQHCHPVKLTHNGRVIGIGTTITHQQTAWLAHIIVHPEYRNKGIGTIITKSLVDNLRKEKYTTIFLIATSMGEQVYKKLGFQEESEYLFFKEGLCKTTTDDRIIKFSPEHSEEIYHLDKKITGENRETILKDHIKDSYVYLNKNKTEGYFIPGLGEGFIAAMNDEAGLALLKYKHQSKAQTVVPAENESAIKFLNENGFTHHRTAKRMKLGKKIDWEPRRIFSRISGSLG